MTRPSAVGLVPARSGSQRVAGKNLALLGGHPLLAYAIGAAVESGLFDAVVVSTDAEEIAAVARRYGAAVPCLRPAELAGAESSDIDWVLHMRDVLARDGASFDLFSIVRPTSPFRTGATLRRAHAELLALGARADSIRAVERCRQHPGKMWTIAGELMEPLLPQPVDETPLHSRQYQALPPVYVQNSSLELAWTHVLDARVPTISGRRVAPFLTEGWEGFSVDYPGDLEEAERALASGEATLPHVVQPAGSAA